MPNVSLCFEPNHYCVSPEIQKNETQDGEGRRRWIIERLDFRNFLKNIKIATETSCKTLRNSKSTAGSGIKTTCCRPGGSLITGRES